MITLTTSTSHRSSGLQSRIFQGLQWLLEAFLILLIAYFVLELEDYDLHIPFMMESDAVVQLLYIKSILDNGWTFSIPALSAPFAMSGAAFPVASSCDWLIMKAMSIVSHSPGLILNSYWLLSLVLSGWSARYAMGLIGVRPFYASIGGILYAFLPFALLRNVIHLNLVYYTVPLLAVFALWLTQPDLIKGSQRRAFLKIAVLASLIQGFNYIYLSFFAAALIVFAFAMSPKKKEIRWPAAWGLAALILASGLNLVPSFWSWHLEGTPPEMGYKYANEAEIYGAKFRKIIAPHAGNPIPILAAWGRKDAEGHFPYDDNESRTARMGLIGSLGLLGTLAISLSIVRRRHPIEQSLAHLSLFTFLMITVGGFGAVFNLLTVPDIRCYNRFSVFLSFFSLSFFFLWLSHHGGVKKHSLWAIPLILALSLLSLYDQTLERTELLFKRVKTEDAYQVHLKAVTQLESEMTHPSKVLMLPLTDFPVDRGMHRMDLYAQGIPYLFSQKIAWSWPSFSYRHKIWQDKLKELHGRPLLDYITLSGFEFIWVNRLGYPDGGDQLIEELRQAGGTATPKGSVQPFEIIDLRGLKTQIIQGLGESQFEAQQQAILSAPVMAYEKGFYGPEIDSDQSMFRWVMGEGRLRLFNHADEKRRLRLSMTITKHPKAGALTLSGPKKQDHFEIPEGKGNISVVYDLGPHAAMSIDVLSTIPRLEAPNDSRNLHFAITNVSLREEPLIEETNDATTYP